jgi:hypothetical protein
MGVEALCKALRSAGSSGLKELDLSHTAADDKAAAALAGLLGASRVLERLVLTHTNITDAGAQLLCNALQVGGDNRGGVGGCSRAWRHMHGGWMYPQTAHQGS